MVVGIAGVGEAFLGDVRAGRREEPRGADGAAPRRHRLRGARAERALPAPQPAVPGAAFRVLQQAAAPG